ncbi:hypothetical protein R6Q57_010839 [Mikania cordata]
MSLANQRTNSDYQKAVTATEEIESPALGFIRPSDFKAGSVTLSTTIIKQNNTLIYLATKQAKRLGEIGEEVENLKRTIEALGKREAKPVDLEDSIESLTKRLDSLAISGKPSASNKRRIRETEKEMSRGIRLPSVLRTSSSSQAQEEPHTQEDQIRRYINHSRRMYNLSRSMQRSYTGFQYNVENVVDHLSTNGITTISGERRTIEDLEGRSWNLRSASITTVRILARVEVSQRLDRTTSLRFRTYRNNPQPPRFSVDVNDREIPEE